ncbi:formate dehydrogenase [Marchantia polymorpha subsp. ruderalis]|uniref:Formate dehydrogenase, mitochondrial n=2 Tax=Marchantia polymorpha TaxID=3197 RepID=A0AAF6B0Y0_MARPO|nr:hypothetical protein MARPO_0004s0175 [Marchantia polymorpha]BBN05664.1 hypothetical protein Mp_3g14970 [Marchantia polymorpha subsp. ruderalis]|eukprot:PTQ48918.1 hypothetical protein MARPO_0004s0175 [Marchantia polymorpha]
MAAKRTSSMLFRAVQQSRATDSQFLRGVSGVVSQQQTTTVNRSQLPRFYSSKPEAGKSLKIVGVLYKAKQYAENPKFLGCAENALGLREWLEGLGHQYIVTDDKEGPNCELEKHIPDMDILITTPFHPAYMTPERIKKAKNLKLALTAGVGSDHINLPAASDAGITVAEISGSNTSSVAEDELLRILLLLRNYLPGWKQITAGGWDVAAVASKSYDLRDKVVATIGAGRIGYELLKRLKPFDCKQLLYWDRQSIGKAKEEETGATREPDLETLLAKCDVVSLNIPLTEKTKNMFNKELISKFKRGAYLVNNARGALVDAEAVKEACESGQLGGYSGDVWNQQPAPADHPWRHMPNHAMTPHLSGTTLDGQARYSAGVKIMLEQFFNGDKFDEQNIIVKGGKTAAQYQ